MGKKVVFSGVSCLGLLLATVVLSGCSSQMMKLQAGQGTFRFTEAQRLGKGMEWRMYPIITDMNGDGKVDIVATHRRPVQDNSLHIFSGAGDGTFRELPQQWSSPGYSALAVEDVNADGKPDVIAASHFNRFHTFLSFDGVRFESEKVLPSLDGYVVARLVDIDGDGSMEAILLGNEKAGIQIFKWRGQDAWQLETTLLEARIGRDFQVVDMNGDGALDLVASIFKEGVTIFFQDQKGRWQLGEPTNFYSATGDFRSLAVADLNSDGMNDIALNGGYAGILKPNGPDVYLSVSSNGDWRDDSTGLKILKKPAEGIAALDLNKDGVPELIVGGNVSGGIDEHSYGLFLFSKGSDGTWDLVDDSGLPQTGMTRCSGMATGDVNSDGIPDLVTTHGALDEGGGYLIVWLGQLQ